MLNSFPLASRSLGYFATYAVGPVVSYLNLVLFSLISPIVSLLLFFLLPESPYQLFSKDKIEKAEKTIRWLRKGASEDQLHSEITSMKVNDWKQRPYYMFFLYSTFITFTSDLKYLRSKIPCYKNILIKKLVYCMYKELVMFKCSPYRR